MDDETYIEEYTCKYCSDVLAKDMDHEEGDNTCFYCKVEKLEVLWDKEARIREAMLDGASQEEIESHYEFLDGGSQALKEFKNNFTNDYKNIDALTSFGNGNIQS